MNPIPQPFDAAQLLEWACVETASVRPAGVRRVIDVVLSDLDDFVRWSARALLLLEGCDRSKLYHAFPAELAALARAQRVRLDTRSNGPAISAFLMAGGSRPQRFTGTHDWPIHHLYNTKFAYPGRQTTTHAVKESRHFTQSAGLVAAHPVAHALAEEYPHVAWFLRAHAFLRFGYDPDAVFDAEPVNEFGFRERTCAVLARLP